MNNKIRTLFVEKKEGFALEGEHLLQDLRNNLNIKGISNIRVINRYDISGVNDEEYEVGKKLVFSERNVDNIYDEKFPFKEEDRVFSVRYLPGQFDQRADSALQCMQLLIGKEIQILSSKVIVLSGDISEEEFIKIKNYYINSVDSGEISLKKPEELTLWTEPAKDIKILDGFIHIKEEELSCLLEAEGFAMSIEDLKFVQSYFRDEEKRNPTITEMKVIDTYWSDHCRHTTFQTIFNDITIKDGHYSSAIKETYEEYLQCRKDVYQDNYKPMCLMDLATIGMKELRKTGMLEDLDVSDEINACSINIKVDVDGTYEDWLLMFKNETHNHPTEIEPFGGAATCVGGAIRDPLSGRAYVYQAMRVTGSGDPRTKVENTIEGKLSQRKITIGAANGYSSYGNQIGLPAGQVTEIYDEGYIAKRMEIGAVIAAAPKENVVRKKPVKGDLIILLGGRTGRDGCGGATGSSKEHTEESIKNCSSEVQKGNAPMERKIQRLFRNPEVSRIIKKCNDFGAGGVSVAIGELCEGLNINLDLVPKKYHGLDGTELAISESQERMAVVVAKENVEKFLIYSKEENLEATVVAEVTDDNRLKMSWRGKCIVDLSRKFIDTNGVTGVIDVEVNSPNREENFFTKIKKDRISGDIKKDWINLLSDLNICSQRGLVERFDSTIGGGTVLMPFGGKYQRTPAEGMVAKIPLLEGKTNTGSIMTFGFNPRLSKWSPFHGATYAVIESLTKIVCCGGNYKSTRLTFQEYFEKLNVDAEKWGKPFTALLGALKVQREFKIAAIGGKDSMSGTFKDLDVPPTLVSFGVSTLDIKNAISPEFKETGSVIVLLPHIRKEHDMPDFKGLKKNYSKVTQLIDRGLVLSASSVKYGGLAEALSKMAFGNEIGFNFITKIKGEELFEPQYGSIVLELRDLENIDELFEDVEFKILGKTIDEFKIKLMEEEIDLKEVLKAYEEPLEDIFPTKGKEYKNSIEEKLYNKGSKISPMIKVPKPRVFIPVFPGTNCEYDSSRAFKKAGAEVSTFVFRNASSMDVEESIKEMVKNIQKSNIIMLPGGFSAGDEPDGSGKFIATVFRNPRIKESVLELLKNRDGLMLGICNGFQALIKLGLVPYGEIVDIEENSPTLTYNGIGRHVSQMVTTKVVSNLSPWLSKVKVGDMHTIPVSHGEGRFVANMDVAKELLEKGQIATQYVDFQGNPTYDIRFNPNGSLYAVEGLTSPDGRILGKMGHSERKGEHVGKNILGEKDQLIFEAGVEYFK
ncbi:phosphoribosylformylglycinamidine synthase [Clostridium sp. MSJ-11]|uniref:Phosphoribosylformylglycinamidine synthase n=1 Tax=Clostridium mobile TaxID=2841512 RepID=A0ABS6EK60_9CLOT|nr:phosphoribosylformylglycinamidine synthase [Clostridium mobile]